MAISARDTYLENRISQANPVELVQILYESAIGSVEKARRHLKEGDIAARSKEISRASAILIELASSLNREAAPELVQNLLELYDYMERQLTQANLRQEEAPLLEVSKLLGTLLEGWVHCQPAPAAPAAPVEQPLAEDVGFPPADAGEYVRQSWTA